MSFSTCQCIKIIHYEGEVGEQANYHLPRLVANVGATSTLCSVGVNDTHVAPAAVLTNVLARSDVQTIVTILILRALIDESKASNEERADDCKKSHMPRHNFAWKIHAR